MRKMLNSIGLGRVAALPALFACAAACVLSASSAKASVNVAYWTFATSTTTVVSGSTANGNAELANVTATLAVTTGTTAWSTATGGSTLNFPAAQGTAAATYALHASDSAAAPVITIEITGSGLSALSSYVLTYAGGSSSATTRNVTWAYSLNDTTFTTLQTDALTGTGAGPTYAVKTDNFSADTSLNGATTIYFRGTFGAATTGGAYFDNIVIAAVPEPTNYALAGFGLMFVGVGASRFYLGRRRSTTAG